MNRLNLLFAALTSLVLLFSCSPKKDFKSDVETKQKPWTNLDFYNDPNHFQFAIVADRTGGMRPGIFEKGIQKLNLVMPEFVMCVGDLIQGYTTDTAQIAKEWEETNQIISGFENAIFLPARQPRYYQRNNGTASGKNVMVKDIIVLIIKMFCLLYLTVTMTRNSI